MPINLRVNVEGNDRALRFLRDLGDAPESRDLWAVLGRAQANLVQGHLYEKDAAGNALGGPRTHFYRGAGDSVDAAASPGRATVSVSQVGLRLRWKGGVVRAKDKLLTIPTDPRAHAKRAGEFDNLAYVPRNRGATKGLLFQEDRLLYVLRSEVTHAPDPSVMPRRDEHLRTATRTAEDYLHDHFGKGPQ